MDVEGAVSDEERQCPRPHPFPLACVVGSHGCDVAFSVLAESCRAQMCRYAPSGKLIIRVRYQLIWSATSAGSDRAVCAGERPQPAT